MFTRTSNGTIYVTYSKLPMIVFFMTVMLRLMSLITGTLKSLLQNNIVTLSAHWMPSGNSTHLLRKIIALSLFLY